MSADSQLITAQGSYSVCLSASLPDTQQHVIKELLDLLPTGHMGNMELDGTTGSAQLILNIKSWIDGRGLACPMPLLKTKVALRDVAAGESLYVVATDPNSKADITAFCQQSQQAKTTPSLGLTMSEMTDKVLVDGATSQRFDTIYHFIITKTDSN
ncbi:sulfurtransferase TusA family protein [Psychrobacter sp. PAMC 21119]|uniref:sulfurtransferase TusA family protein n=1 Tax=Psychrobacter sp. PAMC 21119 TaxID=1112209 RepID=UPI0002889CCB|nr:sulfurtransferase TusA family protein [Psychrobacter sp. PAMC 21119]